MAEEGLLLRGSESGVDDAPDTSQQQYVDSNAAGQPSGEGRQTPIINPQYSGISNNESQGMGMGTGSAEASSLSSVSPVGSPERVMSQQVHHQSTSYQHRQTVSDGNINIAANTYNVGSSSGLQQNGGGPINNINSNRTLGSLPPPAIVERAQSAQPAAAIGRIPNGSGSAAPTPIISNPPHHPSYNQQQQQQQQQQQPRRAKYRTKNKLATNAGAGIKHGLRRTGRLFRGKRRRSRGYAGVDDDDDDDDDANNGEGGARTGRSSTPRSGRQMSGGGGGAVGGRFALASPTASLGGNSGMTSPAGVRFLSSPSSMRSGGGGSHYDAEWDETTTIVRGVESTLRYVLIVLGAFLLGAARTELVPIISKAVELGCAAWVTCALILVLTAFRGGRTHIVGGEAYSAEEPVADVSASPIAPVYQHEEARTLPTEETPLLDNNYDQERDAMLTSFDVADAVPSPARSSPVPPLIKQSATQPELDDLHLINCANFEKILPNSDPVILDNDLFRGKLFMMVRTSDADEPANPSTQRPFDATQQAASDYFRTKQRRFEFQFQLKLKKVPEGPLFLSCEVEDPIKMGMVQRAFVGACLNFVKKMNKGFHSFLTGQDGVSQEDIDSGRYEKTNIAFTVEASMDALVATKPGETLPTLGEPIVEDPESLRHRKKGGKVNWNTEDIYTMGLWSAYVDFTQWKCLNFPGIKPFSMTSVGGTQPINLTLYILKNNSEEEPKHHYECDKETVTHLEISHTANMSLGPYAKMAEARERTITKPLPVVARVTSAESHLLNESFGADADEDDEDGNILAIEEDEEDVETLDELAEGMYLRSGEPITLREAGPSNDTKQDVFVANGGGFAIVQRQASSMIVIEKANSTMDTGSRSKFIKSGDIVSVKLIVRKEAGTGQEQAQEIKYLSIHRGWWLKWVNNMPKHNGYFKIYSQEAEGALETVSLYSSALGMQMTYIQLGQSFSLHHKRWSRFQVGVSLDSSVKFGGRMLGLHKKSSTTAAEDDVGEVEGLDALGPQNPFENFDGPTVKGTKKQWMRPVRFRADALDALEDIDIPLAASTSVEENTLMHVDSIQAYTYNLDAPAWIEMTHRTRRQRQRAYVVRIVKKEAGVSDSQSYYSLRLKTGKDLAPVLKIGLRWREEDSILLPEDDIPEGREEVAAVRRPMPAREEDRGVSDAHSSITTLPGGRELSESPADAVEKRRSITSSSSKRIKRLSLTGRRGSDPTVSVDSIPPSPSSFHFDNDVVDEAATPRIKRSSSLDALSDIDYEPLQVTPKDETESEEECEEEDDEGLDSDEDGVEYVDDLGLPPLNAKGRRKKKWIKSSAAAKSAAKVAKTVKSGTTMTGKHVVKQGRKVGKGTVSAGKAAGRAITSVPTPTTLHKPPRREPRKRAPLRRGTVKDHHVAINKAVGRTLKRSSSMATQSERTKVTAGRLCAPDQSCRTVSHILEELSTIAQGNTDSEMTHLVQSQAETSSDLEAWFLRGDAVELGIVPAKTTDTILGESVVARCLWDSHWREEWCALYKTRIELYAPFTKKPSNVVTLDDVQSVRPFEPSELFNPLPGASLLAIETAWRCTYLAFADEDSRNAFAENIKAAIFTTGGEGRLQDDSYRANLWQGFSAQSLVASGRGKWEPITVSSKRRQRIILNSRRMVFDVEPFNAGSGSTVTATDEGVEVRGDVYSAETFVETLLMKACSFSVESLETNPKDFVDFLDATSRLRSLPLSDLNFASNQACCLMLNLYHCLLQHALLLSINGPPDKKSVGYFKRCSCYEIGGDVFSLAELECCVIRGKMSSAVNARAPYIEAPKISQGYRFYALGATDPRVNFVLNQGDTSSMPTVPVLNPEVMEDQLNAATGAFLSRQVGVDVSKRLILLPKVCDIYRKDFGQGDPYDCISFCLQHLDEETQAKVIELFTDETNAPSIKYRSSSDQFHANLQLML